MIRDGHAVLTPECHVCDAIALCRRHRDDNAPSLISIYWRTRFTIYIISSGWLQYTTRAPDFRHDDERKY